MITMAKTNPKLSAYIFVRKKIPTSPPHGVNLKISRVKPVSCLFKNYKNVTSKVT
jgi:hypothetical protein